MEGRQVSALNKKEPDITTYDTNHAHILIFPVFLPGRTLDVPLGTMNQSAAERIQSLDVWPRPSTESTDSSKQDIRRILDFIVLDSIGFRAGCILPELRPANSEVPFPRIFVIPSMNELVLEFDIRRELPFLDDALKIG